jgi:hypothetical protein
VAQRSIAGLSAGESVQVAKRSDCIAQAAICRWCVLAERVTTALASANMRQCSKKNGVTVT